MKTTDSIMRELVIKVRAVIEDNIEYDGECIVWDSRIDKDLEEVVSHSIAEARREWVENVRKDVLEAIGEAFWNGVDEGGEDYAGEGFSEEDYLPDSLLTGDNPEEAK